MTRLTEPPLVVVMGITGVGKSRIGTVLAERLGVEYADGDDFHSPVNIAKMSAGTPLTDEDRWPWLQSIGRWLREHDGKGGVISCSALRRDYRELLTEGVPRTAFLHLTGDLDLIRSRMEGRKHFMPLSLLESQQHTLEPLGEDENGVAVDIGQTPEEIVEEFLDRTVVEVRAERAPKPTPPPGG